MLEIDSIDGLCQQHSIGPVPQSMGGSSTAAETAAETITLSHSSEERTAPVRSHALQGMSEERGEEAQRGIGCCLIV